MSKYIKLVRGFSPQGSTWTSRGAELDTFEVDFHLT